MTMDGLASLMKQGFKKSQEDMAVMVHDAFQSTQDLLVEKFEKIDEKFEKIDENFKEVKKKIDNISLNIVDVVRKEEFDKLESRVVVLENTPSKK